MDLGTGDVRGFEALCRFHGEPYRPPDVVFAEADGVGLGQELELAVAARALEALRALPEGVYVSINASPATLASGRLPGILDGHPPARVLVEVTEHVDVPDYGALIAEARRLGARGVRLAVDDAGAGYAGLAHILRLRPDVIKLDRSLITGLDADEARRSLVAAMVQFGARTGAAIVAEGIETRAERAALAALGVPLGQGWALGRPAPLAAALALVAGPLRSVA